MLVEGVEVSHIELHTTCKADNTTNTYRVGAYNKRLVVHILVAQTIACALPTSTYSKALVDVILSTSIVLKSTTVKLLVTVVV